MIVCALSLSLFLRATLSHCDSVVPCLIQALPPRLVQPGTEEYHSRTTSEFFFIVKHPKPYHSFEVPHATVQFILSDLLGAWLAGLPYSVSDSYAYLKFCCKLVIVTYI